MAYSNAPHSLPSTIQIKEWGLKGKLTLTSGKTLKKEVVLDIGHR